MKKRKKIYTAQQPQKCVRLEYMAQKGRKTENKFIP